ncbi:MAG: hypothetical protein IKC50_07770 [Oscillospiraceae bacterium]|nr:hypothetical protein [Oscillospiraceae bacterium]
MAFRGAERSDTPSAGAVLCRVQLFLQNAKKNVQNAIDLPQEYATLTMKINNEISVIIETIRSVAQ